MPGDMGLLRRQTLQRVRAAIRTIDTSSGQGFPYSHSRDVLEFLKNELTDLEEDLEDVDPTKNEPATIRALCQHALQYIFEVLPILGLVVRSIDVAGPLELHGPLLRLTHKAIGPDAKLVISSEWDFSPYTVIYPNLLNNLFVLVALPVTEADNALVSPLAAHELGHNIWESATYRKVFESRVEEVLPEIITKDCWEKYQSVFEVKDKAEVDQSSARANCDASWGWAVSQCEEVFCDMIGLLIFREGYLHAFEYLLSPGVGGERVKRYPSMKTRVEFLVGASNKAGVTVPRDYVDRFVDDGPEGDERTSFLLEIADKATNALFGEIFDCAQDFVRKQHLSAHSTDDIDHVLSNLKRAVPATHVKGIENIVAAGWRIHLNEIDYWAEDFPQTKGKPIEQSRILNELLLKSFEVFEIEQLQAEG